MKTRAIMIGIAIIIGVLVSIFSVDSGKVGRWNDEAVDTFAEFGASYQVFQAQIDPYFEGKQLDVAAVDSALAAYEASVKKTAEKLRSSSVPDDELCTALHQSLVEYADLEITQLADMRTIVEGMKAANPGHDQDVKKASDALDALGAKEDLLLEKIQLKQRAMAGKYKITLQ